MAFAANGCSSATGGAETIQVLDNVFSPSTVTIAAGEQVAWAWGAGRAPHNVVFAPTSGIRNSPLQTSGSHFATFPTPGSYPYECTLHPGMTGTINVR